MDSGVLKIKKKSEEKRMSNIRGSIFFILLLPGIMVLLLSCSQKTVKEIEGMVYIPAGEFIIGSNDKDTNALAKEFGAKHLTFFENEKPVRKLFLDKFYIDKFEITHEEYKLFVTKSGHTPPTHWKKGMYGAGKDRHPVINVSWHDADAYCRWADKRLSTEEEWEKASRGPNGNKYPWGNEYDEKKANLGKGSTVPVGSMPEDKSYFGVYDMGGNVMEWTNSWYEPYPGSTFQSKDFGRKDRVLKGGYGSVVGHYNLSSFYSRGSFRNYFPPAGKGIDVGFRCSKDSQ